MSSGHKIIFGIFDLDFNEVKVCDEVALLTWLFLHELGIIEVVGFFFDSGYIKPG